jgi:hypothetical protein
MDRFERLSRFNAREDLIDELTTFRGVEPSNIRRILSMLSHPDMIKITIKYFQDLDGAQTCEKYEAPWNCAREAEAHYENIQYGWSAGVGIGFDGSWCTPCRDRVMGNT